VATAAAVAGIAHRVSSAASVSSGGSHRRHSYMSCKSRMTGAAFAYIPLSYSEEEEDSLDRTISSNLLTSITLL